MTTDFLLLNCTNLPWRPIFPYAFVQVSALARRAGVSVEVLDLLGVPRDRWAPTLQRVLERGRPRLVGLHIRQGDSVFLDDYYAPPGGPSQVKNYFPIDDNRHLVQLLRRSTDAPIIAGGFGFTTHARRLFEHLGIDYGVQGCPDDVIAHFDDLVARRSLGSLAGLMYRDGGELRVNPRGYYGPLGELEYTDAMVDQLARFYGHAQLFGADPPTVAVEVMRGCPFRCFFCTEPHVKGRDLRYRDLDVIEAELDFLLRRGIWRFWLICSELDVQGARFGFALAERIIRLRERHGGRPIEWSAYALPRLDEHELRTLQRAGYAGALNDVLSLDDENLRRARVPYRSKQAVAFLKAVTKLDREDAASEAQAAVAEQKVRSGLMQRTPKELASIIGLFLGNAHATPDTLRRTLRRIDEEGMQENYRGGLAFPATRVFELDGTPICETTPRGLRTYDREGEREPDVLWPMFYYPDFLVDRLGSPAAVIELMRYIGETLLSTAHRSRKDWPWFLSRVSTVAAFGAELRVALARRGLDESAPPAAKLVAADPIDARVRDLFAPPPGDRAGWNQAAGALVAHVLAANTERVAPVAAVLGLDPAERLSEYRVLERLSARFATREALFAELESTLELDDVQRLHVEWVLYANNVVLRTDYRELLFG